MGGRDETQKYLPLTETTYYILLARYVVNTEPTSIVEELLPVAMPIYGDQPSAVNRQWAAQLLNAQPSAQTRTEAEVQEALADALAMEGLERLFEDAEEGRRQELVAERQRMRQQMEAQESAGSAEWLWGIDDQSPGSFDLVTVAVLWLQ